MYPAGNIWFFWILDTFRKGPATKGKNWIFNSRTARKRLFPVSQAPSILRFSEGVFKKKFRGHEPPVDEEKEPRNPTRGDAPIPEPDSPSGFVGAGQKTQPFGLAPKCLKGFQWHRNEVGYGHAGVGRESSLFGKGPPDQREILLRGFPVRDMGEVQADTIPIEQGEVHAS